VYVVMKWVKEEVNPLRIEVIRSSSGIGFPVAPSWSTRVLAACI
jgi:hypothetical protein